MEETGTFSELIPVDPDAPEQSAVFAEPKVYNPEVSIDEIWMKWKEIYKALFSCWTYNHNGLGGYLALKGNLIQKDGVFMVVWLWVQSHPETGALLPRFRYKQKILAWCSRNDEGQHDISLTALDGTQSLSDDVVKFCRSNGIVATKTKQTDEEQQAEKNLREKRQKELEEQRRKAEEEERLAHPLAWIDPGEYDESTSHTDVFAPLVPLTEDPGLNATCTAESKVDASAASSEDGLRAYAAHKIGERVVQAVKIVQESVELLSIKMADRDVTPVCIPFCMNNIKKVFEKEFHNVRKEDGFLVHMYPIKTENKIFLLSQTGRQWIPITKPSNFSVMIHFKFKHNAYNVHKIQVHHAETSNESVEALDKFTERFKQKWEAIVAKSKEERKVEVPEASDPQADNTPTGRRDGAPNARTGRGFHPRNGREQMIMRNFVRAVATEDDAHRRASSNAGSGSVRRRGA